MNVCGAWPIDCPGPVNIKTTKPSNGSCRRLGISERPNFYTLRESAAPRVLASIRSLYPWLRHIFADGGYAGQKLRRALKRMGEWTIEIIKRSDTAQGFEVLPRRWVVERTFAWLGRCRRLAKDFEATIASAVAWALVAHIRTITRRLARA